MNTESSPAASPRLGNQGIDLSLNLGTSNSNAPKQISGIEPNICSTRAAKPMGRIHCTRCLSNFPHRPTCWNRVCCSTCFRLGHISTYCKLPPQFPGLLLSEELPSFRAPMDGDFPSINNWFPKQLPLVSGPPELPPHF